MLRNGRSGDFRWRIDRRFGEINADAEEKQENKFEEIEDKVIQIPDWVKNNAGWWAEGLLSDEEFINAIKFLIEEETIMI